MHYFKYKSAASVCVLLLLGSACARDESSGSNAQQSKDAGTKQDSTSDGTIPRTTAGSRAQSSRLDAGSGQSSKADASTRDSGVDNADKADNAEAQAKASGGSGGAKSGTAGTKSEGGSGGAAQPTDASKGGAGGQQTAGMNAPGGAGGAGGAGGTGTTTEANGGAGGATVDAGSGQQGGNAGDGGSAGEGEAAGAGGAGGAPEEGGDRDAGAGGTANQGAPDCQSIAKACGAVASPGADVMACLLVGESTDATICQARLADCRMTCGAPLCQQLTMDCPDNPADTSRQGCHNLGLAADANNCFNDGADCLDLCHQTMP